MNAFDKFAGTNLLRDINLAPYRNETVEHSVKPATEYRERLISRLIQRGERDPNATALPFNHLHGKFEFRPSEMTVWTGFKGHGKSLPISQALMAAIQRGKRAFIFRRNSDPSRCWRECFTSTARRPSLVNSTSTSSCGL